MDDNSSPSGRGHSDDEVVIHDMVASDGRLVETAEEMRRGCSEGALASA